MRWGLGLGGAGRMAAALLLHLLLINNVFGARTQLLCLLRTPAESASLQPLGNMGAPCDLAAASEFVPKDQRSILELQPYSPAGFSTWGRSSSSDSPGCWTRGWGSERAVCRPWQCTGSFFPLEELVWKVQISELAWQGVELSGHLF